MTHGRGPVACAVSAAVTRLVHGAVDDAVNPRSWSRRNHRGGAVELTEGPAVAAGLAAGLAVTHGAGAAAAVVTAAVAGRVDDVRGQRSGELAAKGLAGHLGALRRGQLTSGVLKIGGLAAAGVLATRGRGPQRLVDIALVAGAANLVNLFDLRPGRALKVAALAGGPVTRGAAAAALPADLAERSMLGDCGANALGAATGVELARRLGPGGRQAALGAVVAMTLASERVSFSRVIDQVPPLRALDQLGRRRG